MKIRQGFVSNSSTSSYMIASKISSEIFDKETLEKYPFLKTFTDTFLSALSNQMEQIKTVKELDKYFVDEHCWGKFDTLEKILDDEEYYRKTYKKCKSKIEEGFIILQADIDYHDESFINFLNVMNNEETFNIIVGE